MIDRATPLENTIRQYEEKRFSIIEPGGNHGDTLIYKGLEKRLEEMGIEYESLHFYKERRNQPSLFVKRELNKLSERVGYLPFETLRLILRRSFSSRVAGTSTNFGREGWLFLKTFYIIILILR